MVHISGGQERARWNFDYYRNRTDYDARAIALARKPSSQVNMSRSATRMMMQAIATQ